LFFFFVFFLKSGVGYKVEDGVMDLVTLYYIGPLVPPPATNPFGLNVEQLNVTFTEIVIIPAPHTCDQKYILENGY
jgi:hypothetical protein